MKKFIFHKAHLSLLAVVFLSVSTVGIQVDDLSATPKPMWDRIEAAPTKVKQELKHGRPELFPMGSGLPDCSHACGPCFPCKRVIVGVKCFVSESCPVVYRCMCKGKYYPVPSN
ncbi:hypothetical protein MRB53_000104 [Persea americana]|uniref:Uncharacterized protein n=1 Tax=Persea americana TaxID=3435 RepID=A0ACC2MMX2_PERAE|nr:hypothetical protein MRB53_000104 [Persea americana]